MPLSNMRLLVFLLQGACFLPLSAQAFSIEDYPLADQLLLGTVPASIEARQSQIVQAPFNGQVERLAPAPGGTAGEGTVLAYFDRERIELEGRLLALERQLTEKQEIPEQQLALFQTLRQIENREVEITQQLAFIEKIEGNPELSKLFGRATDGLSASEDSASRRLESERRATQQMLDYLEDPEVRALAEQLVGLKLRQREIEHEKLLAEARITMPFDGDYTYLLPFESGQSTARVQQGTAVLRMENIETIDAIVEIHGARWRLLPRERLSLRIADSPGLSQEREAPFSHVVRPQGQLSSEAMRYAFAFLGEAGQGVARLRGGPVMAEVFLNFEGAQARIVPKLDLLAAYPEAFRVSWERGAREVFAGLESVHVGRDALALVFPARK